MYWGKNYHRKEMPAHVPFYADKTQLKCIVDHSCVEDSEIAGYWHFHVPIADASQYIPCKGEYMILYNLLYISSIIYYY